MATEVIDCNPVLSREFGREALKNKKFNILREGNTWVRYNRDTTDADQISKDVASIDLFVCDLDDTIVPSPGIEIAFNIGKEDLLNPNYMRWILYSTGQVLFKRGDAVSNSWRCLSDTMREHPVFQRNIHGWTEKKVREKSYEGFNEVCQSLPSNAKKIIISRNDPHILESFSQVYGFDGFYPYQYQKGIALEKFLDENNYIERVLIIGDSKEDGMMVDSARQKGRNVISVCVCPREDKLGFIADLYTYAKNQKLLAKLFGGNL